MIYLFRALASLCIYNLSQQLSTNSFFCCLFFPITLYSFTIIHHLFYQLSSHYLSSGYLIYSFLLGSRQSWALKNWCFWTAVLEKTLESPLDCREIQPLHPKENQSWIFTARTDAEAETPMLWPPDAKSWLTGWDPDAGKDGRQEEKGTTKDEMVGWHHRLDGHKFEEALGVGDGQGSLACWGPWGHK